MAFDLYCSDNLTKTQRAIASSIRIELTKEQKVSLLIVRKSKAAVEALKKIADGTTITHDLNETKAYYSNGEILKTITLKALIDRGLVKKHHGTDAYICVYSISNFGVKVLELIND